MGYVFPDPEDEGSRGERVGVLVPILGTLAGGAECI